jgi:hypothetical protein
VTDQPSELSRETGRADQQNARTPGAEKSSRQSGVSADAIATGLEYLFSRQHKRSWTLCGPGERDSAAWVTAYVLARLGEIPAHQIHYSLRSKIDASVNWLLEIRTPKGGWRFSSGSPDDADSTGWAVVALRQHGRSVPEEPLHLIRRCRRLDGGFAAFPPLDPHSGGLPSSAPDVTAIAVRALASIDAASAEFLASNLRTDLQERPCRLASGFFVASTLLDWEPGMAPHSVVKAVRELASSQVGHNPWEQSLQLRCMMRLRMQSAWSVAAGLRRLQQPDGSWPGAAQLAPLSAAGDQPPAPYFDEYGILSTVTALSALATADLQPGLYFGSDLPFSRL